MTNKSHFLYQKYSEYIYIYIYIDMHINVYVSVHGF